jgi:hypothetical protein
MKRRLFLRGACGALVGLPLLESLRPRGAHAAAPNKGFALFVRQGNGVQQATPDGEPERFWPSFAPGALSPEALLADSGRALSVLSDNATHIHVLRGIRFNDPANACKHSGGGNQVLTAAKVSQDDCNSTLALGESLDSRICRELGAAGEEPLTLFAGARTGYLDEVLSYRGARELRGAERSPSAAYAELFSLQQLPPEQLTLMQKRRQSVNDLVRGELSTLLGRSDLSAADRARLDLHFSSIRDVENAMSGALNEAQLLALAEGSSKLDDDDTIDAVIKLHCDMMVLAVASGQRRAATLQIGAGPDDTRYHVDGVKLPRFHELSHRAGSPVAVDLHHAIDRKLLGFYKYLVDALLAYPLPNGSLLDQGVAVFCSDVANKLHDYDNVPYILAGSAGGMLTMGRYTDAGGVTNNLLLNALGAAVGCKNATGAPLDDFGDPELPRGQLAGLLKGA